MKYRADIDGLRAVAILPVLLFHSGAPGVTGGFVGVDVFFVISGYLISKIIFDEVLAGQYSIVRFYERRARRILPALLAVSAFVLAVSAAIMLPVDFKQVPGTVAAANLFGSNILFYLQAGYFDEPGRLKPMLHTWSLGVEEQFYIFFPFLLLIVHRISRKAVVPVVVAVAALSFAAAAWGAVYKPWFTFYMTPTRVWELFAGSILALQGLPNLRSRPLREVLAVAGLALIAVPVFTYTSKTTFPGLAAALPVGGSALLIAIAPGTSVGRLLSSKPMTFVGLISYSLYLWHWPIIVFVDYLTDRAITGWMTVLVVGLSFAAAYVSWRYVERPFRQPGVFSQQRIFQFAAAGLALACGASVAAWSTNGWASRFPAESLRLEQAIDDVSPTLGRCNRGDGYGPPIDNSCQYGAPVKPTIAVLSDSHGIELTYVLGTMARRRGVALQQYSYSGCLPFVGAHGSPECKAFRAGAMRSILENPDIATVIIAAFYDTPVNRTDPATLSGLESAVSAFTKAGKNVVLVYPVPNQDKSVPRRQALYVAAQRDPNELGVATEDFLARNADLLRAMDRLVSDHVVAVRPYTRLCDAHRCRTMHDGAPLYFDGNHLSVRGAWYVSPLFDDVFNALGREHQQRTADTGQRSTF